MMNLFFASYKITLRAVSAAMSNEPRREHSKKVSARARGNTMQESVRTHFER